MECNVLVYVIFLLLKVGEFSAYKAAVLEHHFFESDGCLKISNLTEQVNCIKLENLAVYEKHAKTAHEQNVDIIVFPEQGLHGPARRARVAVFAENIPNPNKEYVPCTSTDSPPAQRQLSCMARSNNMYVVANMVDVQRKPNAVNEDLYNTAVAYDRQGHLVAKYHKRNLFAHERDIFDTPNVEYSYFDTSFGRVGIFVCFDVLFRRPAYELVERYNVTDIAFPTAWIDELPMWSAVGVHSAWAMTMKVNFLSANYRSVEHRMLGSGIYTPDGPLAFYRQTTNENKSHLIVASVPAIRPRVDSRTTFSESFFPEATDTFNGTIFYDEYTFIKLDSGTDKRKKVCMNGLCCKLKYSATIDDNEKYVLGVFCGKHTAAQQRLTMQNCVVTKCASLENSSCGERVDSARTRFKLFHLEGNFNTKYVFPTVLTDAVQLAKSEEYKVMLEGNAYIFSQSGFDRPLLFSALHGRKYFDSRSMYEVDINGNAHVQDV